MTARFRPPTWSLAALTLTGLVALTGCAPGSSSDAPAAKSPSDVSTDVAKAGKVTLTVWDAENGEGTNPVVTSLNKAFEAKYPNVTVKRTTRDFANLKTTLKLALSSNNPPDVVEVNQGYPDMGAFVKAGLIQPLDGYAKVYDWTSRIPETARELDSFSTDGSQIGTGKLYGVPQIGSLVSFYYNKQKLSSHGLTPPKTWDDLLAAMDKIKSDGDTPLWFGNQDKYEAIGLFATILDSKMAAATCATWSTVARARGTRPEVVAAAQEIVDWTKKGYLTSGANGLAGGQALSDFSKGKGVFYLDGDWDSATLGKSMGGNVGHVPPAAGRRRDARSRGRPGRRLGDHLQVAGTRTSPRPTSTS